MERFSQCVSSYLPSSLILGFSPPFITDFFVHLSVPLSSWSLVWINGLQPLEIVLVLPSKPYPPPSSGFQLSVFTQTWIWIPPFPLLILAVPSGHQDFKTRNLSDYKWESGSHYRGLWAPPPRGHLLVTLTLLGLLQSHRHRGTLEADGLHGDVSWVWDTHCILKTFYEKRT